MVEQEKSETDSFTNPAINVSISGVGEGCHSGEPVVAVQDSQAARVSLQDDGSGHLPCTCNVIAGTEKLLFGVYDICDSCLNAAYMLIYDGGNDLLRAWVEESREKRDCVPFPRELANRLEALTVKHLKPS